MYKSCKSCKHRAKRMESEPCVSCEFYKLWVVDTSLKSQRPVKFQNEIEQEGV